MATALLLRRRPDDGDDAVGSLRAEGETASAAALRLATSLRHSYLPMQGPPGTGKTYTAAEQILELIARGRTVGITGPSHAGHLPPHRHRVRAREVARSRPAADRPAGGPRQSAPARGRHDDEQRAAGEGPAGRRAGRRRGHGVAVGAFGAGGQRGHLVRGRGGPAVAGQRAGGGRGGAEPDPAGRPAAAGPAESRHAPARGGRLRAGAHPGRPGHDAGRRRAAARPDLADAPGPVPVHLGGVLRRQAGRRRRAGPPGDPGLGLGAAPGRGAAPGEHERLAGRGRARWRGWRGS